MEADQLIREVARATGLRLDKSDPILAAAVLNELLLEQALAKLDRQVKAQADRITAASTQAVVDAKMEAEALLTDAGEWIEARIKAAGDAAAARILSELVGEVSKIESARRSTTRIASILIALTLILISGVTGIALACIR